MDKSRKYGMEYRLLHSVTIGRTWYGDWGYEFGAGSYALTAEAYHEAVDSLSNIPLSLFFSHARSPRSQLQNVISLYRSLSDHHLATVRDLFCYLMGLLRDASVHHHRAGPEEYLAWRKKEMTAETASEVVCLWTKDDVNHAEIAIVKVLRAADMSRWLTWRSLRGATCRAVESPELLDYCLKGLDGKSLDEGMVIATRFNAEARAIEFRLEAISDQPSSTQIPCSPSLDHLLNDLKFLYESILNPATMYPYKPQATRESALQSATKLLDCKQFINHYDKSMLSWASSNPFVIHIWCHAELVGQPDDFTAPPPELLVLPGSATVADLKQHASKAFRDTYLIFQRFEAEQLLDYGYVKESTAVKLLFGQNGVVRVRGRCHGDERRLKHFRMERGTEVWTVDCSCGAKDDDGERMMACDVCQVWLHTRCAGINDSAPVPAKFVCIRCNATAKKRGRPRNSGGGSLVYLGGPASCDGRCNNEMTALPLSMDGAWRHEHVTTVG